VMFKLQPFGQAVLPTQRWDARRPTDRWFAWGGRCLSRPRRLVRRRLGWANPCASSAVARDRTTIFHLPAVVSAPPALNGSFCCTAARQISEVAGGGLALHNFVQRSSAQRMVPPENHVVDHQLRFGPLACVLDRGCLFSD